MAVAAATKEPTAAVRQWRAVAPPRGAPPVTLPARRAEQQLSQRTEATRRSLLDDTRKRWGQKAREATTETSYHYAADRAAALGRDLQPRLDACGTRGHYIACKCPGKRLLWRGCRQWWVCRACRARRLNPLRERLTDSLGLHIERAITGGNRVGVRMLTFSLRTSGDVPRDRAQLGEAWRTFYQALHRWMGRFVYAGVYEVTPGTTGLGHVHMHVVVVWPRWVNYARVAKLWRDASKGNSTRISIVGGSNNGRRAASYLAKYVSKGVDTSAMSEELVGGILAAFYNQRQFTTSTKFWSPKPVCNACGEHAHRCEGFRGSIVDSVAADDVTDDRPAAAAHADGGARAGPDECGDAGTPRRLL